jgi:multisite-specific tRNA:(cytosine-C5)-methyltransferase
MVSRGSLTCRKKVLRKNPEFKKFHSFLVYETEVVCECPSQVLNFGAEMVRETSHDKRPSACFLPLFLQVEPHHKVVQQSQGLPRDVQRRLE